MARAVRGPLELAETRERFVLAGLKVLHEYGTAELTVRRVAELAGSSTMGIYSRFGGRTGMLEAVYQRGFEMLRDALVAGPVGQDAPSSIMALGMAYRRFALAHAALYALMFERPLPDFDPAPEVRAEALRITFTPLADEVARAQRAGLVAGDDPVRPAYLLWTAMHGIISIELTHAVRSPLPGWFVDSPEAGERVLVDGVASLLAGLRLRRPTDPPAS